MLANACNAASDARELRIRAQVAGSVRLRSPHFDPKLLEWEPFLWAWLAYERHLSYIPVEVNYLQHNRPAAEQKTIEAGYHLNYEPIYPSFGTVVGRYAHTDPLGKVTLSSKFLEMAQATFADKIRIAILLWVTLLHETAHYKLRMRNVPAWGDDIPASAGGALRGIPADKETTPGPLGPESGFRLEESLFGYKIEELPSYSGQLFYIQDEEDPQRVWIDEGWMLDMLDPGEANEPHAAGTRKEEDGHDGDNSDGSDDERPRRLKRPAEGQPDDASSPAKRTKQDSPSGSGSTHSGQETRSALQAVMNKFKSASSVAFALLSPMLLSGPPRDVYKKLDFSETPGTAATTTKPPIPAELSSNAWTRQKLSTVLAEINANWNGLTADEIRRTLQALAPFTSADPDWFDELTIRLQLMQGIDLLRVSLEIKLEAADVLYSDEETKHLFSTVQGLQALRPETQSQTEFYENKLKSMSLKQQKYRYYKELIGSARCGTHAGPHCLRTLYPRCKFPEWPKPGAGQPTPPQ